MYIGGFLTRNHFPAIQNRYYYLCENDVDRLMQYSNIDKGSAKLKIPFRLLLLENCLSKRIINTIGKPPIPKNH